VGGVAEAAAVTGVGEVDAGDVKTFVSPLCGSKGGEGRAEAAAVTGVGEVDAAVAALFVSPLCEVLLEEQQLTHIYSPSKPR